MSALGHKRTFCDAEPCPLCPRKRTCAVQLGMSALGHKQTFRHSFDHLVCTSQHSWRHLKPESLCSFRIDYKLEFNRLLNWQLCWLGAFKNLPRVGTHLSVSLRKTNTVT